MHPRKFVRDSMGFAFAQYVVRATLMLRGLVAARFLGPEAWGAWNAIQMLMDSAPLAAVGTQQGLDQSVPARIVSGDAAALERVKRAALFNIVLLTGAFVAACLFGVAFSHSQMLHAWGYLGVGAACLCAVGTNLSYYQSSIMRSHGDITLMSVWLLIQGGVGGALGLALLPWLHVWGLLAGWLVGSAVAYAFSHARSREHAPMRPLPSAESFDLVQVGFPMFVFMASSQILMRMLDRLIILHYVNNTALGYYSLSVMALAFLMNVPDSITYVIYPRLLRQFGESGRDPAAIRPNVDRVLRLFAVMLPLVSGIAFLCAQPLVALLLPRYLPGVPALRVLCFGAVALAFASLASVVLMTLERQMMLIPAAIFGLAVYGLLDVFAVKTWHDITAVAWATLIGYVVNCAVLVTMALAGMAYGGRRLLSTLGRLFLPMALALAMVAALDRFLPWTGRSGAHWAPVRLGSGVAIFALAYGGAVYPLTRGSGLLQLLSEFNLPVIGPLLRRFRRAASGEAA